MLKNLGLDAYTRIDEARLIPEFVKLIDLDQTVRGDIVQQACKWVNDIRMQAKGDSFIDQVMSRFSLEKDEGLLLMALAESFMRIPDEATQDLIIQDKLSQKSLQGLMDDHNSVIASLSSKLLNMAHAFIKPAKSQHNFIKNSLQQTAAPFIRKTVHKALGYLANQYVMAPHIDGALNKISTYSPHYKFSFDMLGEAALTEVDAARYYQNYDQGLDALIALPEIERKRCSLSIKLSALHPRYEVSQHSDVERVLLPQLIKLCSKAAMANVSITIDAEESNRLDLSLIMFEHIARHFQSSPWQGLGLAVQAYQKRALNVLKWLLKLSQEINHCFNVRLVKGAYWDTEIKGAQELGLIDYPVFTQKVVTDVSYLACAKFMLEHPKAFSPSFATHNAHTIAAICHMAKSYQGQYEFQALYGMGHKLYDYLIENKHLDHVPVRFYAPIGAYHDLLPYLVRRLLENGANSSFVNALLDPKQLVSEFVQDPLEQLSNLSSYKHPHIPLPPQLFDDRPNSSGHDLSASTTLSHLYNHIQHPPQVNKAQQGERLVHSPINGQVIGSYTPHNSDQLLQAMDTAAATFQTWRHRDVQMRSSYARKLAVLYQQHELELIRLCVHEAGKTVADAIAEIREAIDFCHYYANEAERYMTSPTVLPGPTGEKNTLHMTPRGIFVCISPWNFPLAIFTGQIIAALVTGNTVVAKPASQTVLIAQYAVNLTHQAGFDKDTVHLVPASGQDVSAHCLTHPKLAGVCFTGSSETAWHINQTLAARRTAIIPLIAETGGQNAMIVDSTALPEQVVKDIIASAFQSAGQRCSALRVVLLQEDVAPLIMTMLKGAMQQLVVGDPTDYSVDIGPVIDQTAAHDLRAHLNVLEQQGQLIYQCSLNHLKDKGGHYIAPSAYLIDDWTLLKCEHFGPILHVMTFKAENIDNIVDQINELGFGLTFGLHTRLDQRMQDIIKHLDAGNIYINRNMIGAVVGVQPFGGQGLSGTGPKAGGPHYLLRFMHEKTVSINTTAQGGNASLMTLKS